MREVGFSNGARANRLRAASRDYGISARMLNDLGARKIRLLSNHHRASLGARSLHLEIVEDRSALESGQIRLEKL